MTEQQILERNAHISDEEIYRDIADTEAEILQLQRELRHYESAPQGARTYRLDQLRADYRRNGIRERQEFIGKLRNLLAMRVKASLAPPAPEPK